MLQAANITRFNVSTVLEEEIDRNRKSRPFCEEAVDDGNFLWNAQENRIQIFAMRNFRSAFGAKKRREHSRPSQAPFCGSQSRTPSMKARNFREREG